MLKHTMSSPMSLGSDELKRVFGDGFLSFKTMIMDNG